MKVVLGFFAAIAVAAGAGWFVGASGRAVVEQERGRAEMRAEFADARASVLEGQVALFHEHAGSAVEAFQHARDRITEIQGQLREIGQPEQAGRLEIALSHLSDAQHMASAFDPRGQDAADQALTALLRAGGG